MTDELNDLSTEPTTDDLTVNFDEIKEVASKNINSMLKDLQDFEQAIKTENIPDIYRIYKGRLHKELKDTSNQNHEIDALLSKKLHDSFIQKFPFMVYVKKVSPTIHYYKVDTYYRERATICLDASIPEISILPTISEEWEEYKLNITDKLAKIEQEIDQIDANLIAAQTELKHLDQKLKALTQQRATIDSNKGFFGRGKTDDETESLDKQINQLQEQKEKWLPYIQSKEATNQQKEKLMQQYEETRLQHALITKEQRLIVQHFGSIEGMYQQLAEFLTEFLNPTKGAIDHD